MLILCECHIPLSVAVISTVASHQEVNIMDRWMYGQYTKTLFTVKNTTTYLPNHFNTVQQRATRVEVHSSDKPIAAAEDG